jgi:hypothetical protein
MKREDAKSPFTGVTSENDDVKSFDPRNGPSCAVQDFRVDLRGDPKSLWNISAAKVFTTSFTESGLYACKDVEKIKIAFFSHLKYLKRDFASSQLEPTAKEKAKREARRDQRKRTVSTLFATV